MERRECVLAWDCVMGTLEVQAVAVALHPAPQQPRAAPASKFLQLWASMIDTGGNI